MTRQRQWKVTVQYEHNEKTVKEDIVVTAYDKEQAEEFAVNRISVFNKSGKNVLKKFDIEVLSIKILKP